jgi:hypothetical protein
MSKKSAKDKTCMVINPEISCIAIANPLDYYVCMITIAEIPEYIRQAEKLLNPIERQDIVSYLAAHPKSGDLIEGTGGIRKLRWGRGGRGKSGGVRVIFYYHSELMPLYLLTLFAKNEQDNLSKAERNDLAKLVDILVEAWIER